MPDMDEQRTRLRMQSLKLTGMTPGEARMILKGLPRSYGSTSNDPGEGDDDYGFHQYHVPIKDHHDEDEDRLDSTDDDSVSSEETEASELSAWLPWGRGGGVDSDSDDDYYGDEEAQEEEREEERELREKDRKRRLEEMGPAWYFRVMGFEKDPLTNSPDLRLSMMSNLSASYNVVNVSIALAIMLTPHSKHLASADATSQSLCSSALIAGMILGQLAGGAIGDSIGRHVAMALVMILQILSSLGSALSFGVSLCFVEITVFHALALWRFLLGVGCGGVYPLAATLTAESTTAKEDRGKLVALTFSMQGIGYIFAPIIGYILVKIFGESSDVTWRILLGLGCVPGLFLMAFRLQRRKKVLLRKQMSGGEADGGATVTTVGNPSVTNLPCLKKHHASIASTASGSTLGSAAENGTAITNGNRNGNGGVPFSELTEMAGPAQEAAAVGAPDAALAPDRAPLSAPDPPQKRQDAQLSVLTAIRRERELVRKLLGTAGTWFLFDVLFYGNTLFQRVVLTAAFGDDEDVIAVCRDGFIVTGVALPGYFLSVAMVGRQCPRRIQMQGFSIMAVLYAVIGTGFEGLARYKGLLLALYGSTFLFANYGPNSTTFMLPSMTFSFDCRSTLNGISAASGKAGALLGASLFEPASKAWGDPTVMVVCSALSAVGLALTWACVPDDVGRGGAARRAAKKAAAAAEAGEEAVAPAQGTADAAPAGGAGAGPAEPAGDGKSARPPLPPARKKRSRRLRARRDRRLRRVRFSSPSLIDFVEG